MEIKENIELAPYTTFKIGGPARYLGSAKTKEDIIELLNFAKTKNLPFFILGRGSNTLISDKGFNGLIILNQLSGSPEIDKEKNKITANSNLNLAELVKLSIDNGLAGLEWAIGIPGSVGGALWANAGAFGKETKDFVEEVKIVNLKTGKEENLSNAECRFSYRDSIFKHHPEFFILEVILNLKKGESQESQRLLRDYLERRNSSQDLSHPSAGCIFKNIPWSRRDIKRESLFENHPELQKFLDKPAIPAGFLIDSLNLKGTKIGGAMISKKHGNYIINTDNAKAEDIIMLISAIKEKIHRHFGIQLEEEIQYVGF